MSFAAGQPVRIRAFAEHQEIPVISADVSAQPNSPAQASIQVPPSPLAMSLKERTKIDIFYLDPNEVASNLLTYRGRDDQNPRPTNPTLYELARQQRGKPGQESDADFERDTRNTKYRLLFTGELVGVQWVKTPTTRSVVLQCIDMSNYWDYAYQFNSGDLFGPSTKALFSGGSTNLLGDILSSPGEIVTGLLRQPSANYPALKGLLGGLIRMIEGIGGCYFQDNKFEGQNIFYSLAELRLHISQMIVAHENDETVSKLLGASYDGLFGRTIGNLGDQVSIRTVLNALMGVIFHETYSIPTPAFFPGTNSDTLGRNRQKLSSLPKYNNLMQLALYCARYCNEANTAIERPPVSSQEFPTDPSKDIKSLETNLQKLEAGFVRQRSLLSQDPVLKRNPSVMGLLPQIAARLRAARAVISKQKVGVYSSPRAKNQAGVALNQARVLANRLYGADVDVSDPKTRTPSRLACQIFRPDIWFGAPPRCNVVFPEQLFEVQYGRAFMKEPTRLMLKVHDEFGEDEFFDHMIFAPMNRTQKGKKSTLQALLERDIMEHELFTGILPLFTKMGELNIFALRTGEVNGEDPKIGLAQRTANYMYFKQRFASRSMEISMMFNPYLATGFPGLILDSYVKLEDALKYQQIEQSNHNREPTDLAKLLGTHFLGNFAAVTHSISLQSATTQVQVQYPRLYDESTEFFGTNARDDQTITQRYGSDVVRRSPVAALSKPILGALGPAYGVIDEIQDITDEASRTGIIYPIYTGPRRRGDPALEGKARIGVPVRLGDVSGHLAQEQGPNKMVTFRAYMVTEKVPRYRKEVIDLPAEELIRPGWYDDCWHPSAIGAVYHEMLRTGSITDKTQIGDPDGVPAGAAKQVARDQLSMNAAGQQDTREGISPAVLTLDRDSSIEQAVRFLLLTYSYIKQGGLSMDRFIAAYTYRPVASMVDLYGTSDLELDALGVKVVKGVEGFHSRAAGPYNDLFGLVTPEITEVLGAKKADQARQLGDTREAKYRAVQQYLQAITSSFHRGHGHGF